MSIPVYLFVGFLDAGKTSFVQETLEDPDFNTGEKTLLVLCEDGEAEYDPAKFAGGNVTIFPVEKEGDLSVALFKEYQRQHRVDRVLIEYNGMWNLPALYDAMPKDWEFYQIITVADAGTFPGYMNNLRQLAVDKLRDPEVVVFNRCTAATDKSYLHKAVRMVNRRAQIIFEHTDGSIEPDETQDELPFDLTQDEIVIGDEDFGIWFLDAMDDPEKYEGKTLAFKAYVCQTPRAPKGAFVGGRFCMTCCAEDISFIGIICEMPGAADLPNRSWVDVRGRVEVRPHPVYGGPGPWLVDAVAVPGAAPEDELVYFLR